MSRYGLIGLSVLFAAIAHGHAGDAKPAKLDRIDYSQHVEPILRQHCLRCHGEKKRAGGLLLTTRRNALLPSDSGTTVIIPGKSKKSELIRRVTSKDPDVRMPASGKPLDKRQIAILRAWIDQGATWPESDQLSGHWAYQPPKRPTLPHVANEQWPQNPIDAFILDRLENEGLTPSPVQAKAKLVRRLYFDLTGLPPTIEQVDRFINDTRPDAYQRLVERLLASPHYGEHWAKRWLDMARYADSNGFQRDGFRTIWPYRDWVVKAFNSDMPFDRFTVEQIAGDLLPNATPDQKTATGFNRNTTVNVEAGVDREEDRVNAIFDRVNTTSTVFLATTMSCAQCHNHKYDPFTQRDYYQLFAYFNNTEVETKERGTARQFIGPKMKLPQPKEVDETRQKLLSEKADLQKLITIRVELWAKESQADVEQAIKKDKKQLRKVPAALRKILTRPAAKRSKAQKKKLKDYLSDRDTEIKKLRRELNKLTKKIEQLAPPTTLVMQERSEPRKTYTFRRGNFLNKDKLVQPGVPDVLHDLPQDAPKNRLALAQWLANDDNPLTARVAVNRQWEAFFGRGIVETLEDFGTQGAPPTHPQLLDWLATEFQRSGWSMKHIHRLIVTSATYRQSSRLTSELKSVDPHNKLYARGPRVRLQAETIRDNALAIAGMLSKKMGGEPVMPPQPAGIWTVIGNVDNTYRTSKGGDRYRRGLYTIWRRSSPYPSFVAFDAPDRAACVVKRPQTNTPLQALTLMNDPVYIEAALGLARRILTEPTAKSTADRVDFAFRTCLARKPSQKEQKVLERLYQNALQRYRKSPKAAQVVLRSWSQKKDQDPVKWAAWFQVATVLLNLDETINK